ARSEVQLWLRRKHRCSWRAAKGRWGYSYLHDRCRLYRMVGRVSHLPRPAANALGDRWSESRMRENRMYGSMRGRWKRAARTSRGAPALYSTGAPESPGDSTRCRVVQCRRPLEL